MYPTFYYGCVKKGETLEEAYERDRPHVIVSGFGHVSQPSIQKVDTDKMSRMEAITFLHREALVCMPAKAVAIEDNKDDIEWMWGVWLTGPDDLFVEGTEPAVWSQHMIDNARRDAELARIPDREEHVIFLRL
jgi:hypothetical protein